MNYVTQLELVASCTCKQTTSTMRIMTSHDRQTLYKMFEAMSRGNFEHLFIRMLCTDLCKYFRGAECVRTHERVSRGRIREATIDFGLSKKNK